MDAIYLEVVDSRLLAIHLSEESAAARGNRVVKFSLWGILKSLTLAQLSDVFADAGYW